METRVGILERLVIFLLGRHMTESQDNKDLLKYAVFRAVQDMRKENREEEADCLQNIISEVEQKLQDKSESPVPFFPL